ncbi:MAG: hypothetical protein NVS3B21_01080 [Acidimicrobiales bacterium]
MSVRTRLTMVTSALKRLSFRIHVGLLYLVLILSGVYVGTRSSFISDEGALIIQAQMLSKGVGWADRPSLLHRVDPSGLWYPLDLSGRTGDGGFFPFSGHPVHALMSALLYRIGGISGIIAPSILGTGLAALIGAMIVRRFHPGLDVVTLWVLGIGSPLYFDAFMAQGHALAAALCAAAVLVVLWATDGGLAKEPGLASVRRRKAIAAGFMVAALIFGAVLLRNEAVVFALAFAITTVAVAGVFRRSLLLCGWSAAAALGGAFVGRRVERVLQAHIYGSRAGASVNLSVGNVGGSIIGTRLHAFRLTWLEASHLPAPLGDTVLVLIFVLVPIFALLIRHKSAERFTIRFVGGSIGLLAITRLLIRPYVAVPGLLMAFPVAWGASWLLRPFRASFAEAICLVTGIIFWSGVIVAQDPIGGALEWGGRYFALGLPILTPIFLVFSYRCLKFVDGSVRKTSYALLVVLTVSFGLLSMLSLHHEKADNARLVAEVDRMSKMAGADPVVVSIIPWLGRVSWTIYDRTQMLYVPPQELDLAGQRLRAAGVHRITFVSITGTDYALQFKGWNRTDKDTFIAKARDWTISNLTDSGASSAAPPAIPYPPRGGAE